MIVKMSLIYSNNTNIQTKSNPMGTINCSGLKSFYYREIQSEKRKQIFASRELSKTIENLVVVLMSKKALVILKPKKELFLSLTQASADSNDKKTTNTIDELPTWTPL
jgi:hypothetical protein